MNYNWDLFPRRTLSDDIFEDLNNLFGAPSSSVSQPQIDVNDNNSSLQQGVSLLTPLINDENSCIVSSTSPASEIEFPYLREGSSTLLLSANKYTGGRNFILTPLNSNQLNSQNRTKLRKIRNHESAALSRKRKREEETENLEKQVAELTIENQRLCKLYMNSILANENEKKNNSTNNNNRFI